MDRSFAVRFARGKRRCLTGLGVVAVALLAGCQSNTGVPLVENASLNAPEDDGTYQVRSGDTLYSIAWRENVDYQQIAQLNNIQPPYIISVGQRLRLREGAGAPAASAPSATGTQAIPLGGAASSTAGDDDSWLLSSSPAGSSQGGAQVSDGAQSGAQQVVQSSGATAATGAAAGAQTPAPAPVASSTAPSTAHAPQADPNRRYSPATRIDWRWPTEGRLVGGFTDRTDITAGIDIAGQKGQPVYAAGPGIVVYAGSGVRGYGNLVIIKHNDQFLSAYAHNAELSVKEDEVVVTGQQIATMGDTEADQVKLHFEIRQDGQPKDPIVFLPDR
ncbi:peptidoglycan DD-metalloendopeptidase family protein [Halotalea alkalilenta]|uniref:peptidoglycan DD-metalloendopeptidase family protein n=1 Tax=Halotalea alkalilenta TaxID=376489 RepID=UPI000694BDEF|nr:peptidoglycan DD-metalloendopeptidase family protein [Halotalea alkalilenta]